MAVGSISLNDLVAMVRAITRQYSEVDFSREEVERALNAAQGKVFLALPNDVKRALYGDSDDLDTTEASGQYTVDLTTATGSVWDIVAVRQVDSVDDSLSPMFKADLDFVLSVSNNEYRQGVYWGRHGSVLHLSEGVDPDTVRIFYIVRPTDMDVSNDLDLPDEYRRYLVLMSALDLLSFAPGVPKDSVASARQEVVAEGKAVGLYPDLRDGLAQIDAKASSKDEEPLGAERR